MDLNPQMNIWYIWTLNANTSGIIGVQVEMTKCISTTYSDACLFTPTHVQQTWKFVGETASAMPPAAALKHSGHRSL